MSRPLLTATAEQVTRGTGYDSATLELALMVLLPLLKVCAGDDVAGWMKGKGAIFPGWAAKRREKMVRVGLAEHSVPTTVADGLVAQLKAVPPVTMSAAYKEAGL